MTEKQPNSQSNNDEQKQQAATPAESSASPVQPDSVTSTAKPAESPALPAQGDDKKAEEVKSTASPAPPAQPDSSQQSGDKKAEEVKSTASPAPPAKPDSAATSTDEDETLASKPMVPAQPPRPEQENSGSGTNKIPGDIVAAVKRGSEAVPASPAPTAPIPPTTPQSPPASGEASVPVDAPKKPTASQACPNCGHNNRAGVIFCENCGTNLVTGKQPTLGTRDLIRDQEEEAARPLDTKESQAIKSAGSGTFTDDMVLRIEIEGGLTPMLVYPKVEIIFGRRDPSSGNQPDVDMTGYAGYRMGVSRRHAALRLHDNRLDVSDLGSSNGTFLNGQRLDAHQPYQVRDGDEIRLGQMVLKLFFQAGKS